jgi:RAB6A-GEF complex partner protein 2
LRLLEPDSVALSSSAALPSSASVRVAAMDDQELELHGSSAGGGLTGCREAVEVLTRVPKKVSYDVNKDGVKVAVLTFMKSAWRLGETVLGVVELNDREGRARILKAGTISLLSF